MAKKKNAPLRLPESGVALGVQEKTSRPKSRGCLNLFVVGCLFAIVLSAISSILPKSPQQIAATQTAAAAVLAASDVPKSPTKTTATVAPYPDVTVTATIPQTARPTAQTIAVRDTSSKTYYASGSGTNVRSCPKTSCAAVTKIAAGGSIKSLGEVEGDAVNAGNTVWYRVKYEGKDAYVYSGVVKDTKPATTITTVNTGNQASSVVEPPQSVPTAAQFVCPSNCDGAVAMGLSAQQAAACGMDRDGDGVACYGD